MAVVVGVNKNGVPEISAVKGLGEITEEEENKAYELDKVLQKALSKLATKLKKSNILGKSRSKNKVEAYWEFGSVLRKIWDLGYVIPAEISLYWQNVNLRAPKELLAKNRGPNRVHAAYCFRLAGYPKKTALKREWSEWVYLFDSPTINSEERFDKWDEKKINEGKKYLSRNSTRLFAQCLNSILKDIDSSDLDDEELIRCYEGSWMLAQKILANAQDINDKSLKAKLKKVIQNNQIDVAMLMESKVSPEKFSENIFRKILN